MLPVYNATTFIRVIEEGSRNKPWVVLVDIDGTSVPYVLKLFSYEENRSLIINEVLGSVLAKEFDLPVPPPALIKLDNDFINTLKPHLRVELSTKDSRIKFGCKLLEDYFSFKPTIRKVYEIRDVVDVDTVFGFDYFIRNRDRGSYKPNILLRSDSYCLIDHELSFEDIDNAYAELLRYELKAKFYHFHIFRDILRYSHGTKKKMYFSEIQEYIKMLNVSVVIPYLEQLKSYGYDTSGYDKVVEYLIKMKGKSSNFENLMKVAIHK